jgi:hypothetical protein
VISCVLRGLGDTWYRPYWLLLLLITLSSCGGQSAELQPVTVSNNDPLAPLVTQQLAITPPANWTLTADGSGITDGVFVVTITTLSSMRADETMLQRINGTLYEGGRNVMIERQSDSRLVAWFIMNETILTSVQMQARTAVDFTAEHETMLVTIARSVKVGS